MTDEIGHKDIHAAFLAAQPNFTEPVKDMENTHFKNKYPSLRATIDSVKPALNAEGVSLSQPIIGTETGYYVRTVLRHVDSDTVMEIDVPLLGTGDMQKFKSASTYARRIGIENSCCLAPGDEDDDAETVRTGNPMGAALKDAWNQAVLDGLPENATPIERAGAFAKAICEDFKGQGDKALKNRWEKHKRLIGDMETRFPDLHAKIIDSYENAVIANSDAKSDRLPID